MKEEFHAKGSSNVHWARYDHSAKTLEIDFKDKDGKRNSTYRYDGVALEDWQHFQLAESKGQHFAFSIRPKFKGVKTWDAKTAKPLLS